VYKPVELDYVNLADGVEVGSHPIRSKKISDTPLVELEPSVIVDLDQVIVANLSGIGGAFNEIGGEAFVSLPESEQKKLAEALFSPEKGSGFALCRTAVGASDFGLSEYSYSETADDYEMKYFSIERDVPTVLAFINAAQAENDQLRMFASPWSPPGWMKESGSMDGGNKNKEKNVLKADPKIYEAYALYFTKYIQDYATYGVNIDRLIIQNETDMNPGYPGCDMSPEQMAELTFNYIQPAFEDAGLNTELWAGSFRGHRKDAETFAALDGAEAIDGLGLQYCSPATFKALHAIAPGMPLMHTEGKCENGDNSMKQARNRLGEVAMWFNGGSENYCYWNMVLNESSESAWGWKQNSLIKIDRNAKTVTYNADYAPMSLFSRYIRPGDQSLSVSTPEGIHAIAVRNDDRLVVFLQNDAEEAVMQNIELSSGAAYTVELPAQALCAVVFN
jgi:glucosylceramidase